MILFLGKTDIGRLFAEYFTTNIGCEDCYILIHKSDDITEGSSILGKYKTEEEVKKAANYYLEKELPF